MTEEFALSPDVIKEATSYNPFRMPPASPDSAEFNEDVEFIGANVKTIREQKVVEITLRCKEDSPTNPNVRFRTDLWLNTDIATGKVRPANAEERDWKSTKSAIRTLANLQRVLGLPGDEPISALTAPDIPSGLRAHVTIRVFLANNGQHKWDIKRVTKPQQPA